MAEIRLEGLVKSYPGGARAADGLDLTIADGELLALVGPSGCGKTTLLRLIAGLERADAGAVFIGGQRVDGLPPHRRGVAMVFQEPALYPHLSVQANLTFGLRLAGARRGQARQVARETAERLGIGGLLARRPSTLSGGEAQRVALGRALARRPEVLLLDEPLTHLDAPLREELRLEIARQHAGLGGTFLYVAHDQREAMALGQRLAVQRAGRILQVGAPGELYRRPACLFVAEFLGSPGINLWRGRLARSEGGTRFVSDGQELPLPASWPQAASHGEGEVILGVRPEHLAPARDGAPGPVLTMRVERVEEVGAETLCTLSGPARSLVMRAPGGFAPARGDTLPIRMNLQEAHLFDAATEERLLP